MTMKDWQRQIVADAADQPDAPYAALARWAKVHPDTLRKARRRDPEFRQAIEDARAGTVAGDVVDVETFVRSPDFLNLGVRGKDKNGTVYPVVLDELKRINNGEHSVVVLTGGIGSGKTFAAVISLLYQMYRLMCEDNPHQSCGLDPSSPIIFAVANKTTTLAQRNDYALARRMIERSPWFQTHAPHDPRIKSRVQFLKHSIELWPVGSGGDTLLGLNLHSAIIDEINFHEVVERSKRAVEGSTYDAGRESFEGIIRRKLSRFDTNTGAIYIASSRRYKGEIVAQLEQEFSDDPHFYKFDHNAWTANPEAYADMERFAVFQGDQTRPPRVLGEDEDIHPRDRELVHLVPVKFKRQFKTNPTRSLQDILGIAVERVGSYFTDRQALHAAACLPNVLMKASEATGDAMALFPGLVDIPHPTSPRAVHGDLSLSGDCTGICIAHLRGFNNEGIALVDVDGLALVRPPRHGQISLDSVLQLIAAWKAHGVPIQWFSADGFQSADLLQRVQRLGIRAGRLSVDQTAPSDPCAAYEALRLAVVEGRVRFPRDPVVVEELLALEHDRRRNRIDHPPNGSKDLADALAGAVYQLSRVPAWQLIDRVPNAGYAAAVNQPRLGGAVTPIPSPGTGYLDLIRAARGMPTR